MLHPSMSVTARSFCNQRIRAVIDRPYSGESVDFLSARNFY